MLFDAKKSRHGNHDGIGTPDAARTHDLQSRSLTLYPTELRAHIECILYNTKSRVDSQAGIFAFAILRRFDTESSQLAFPFPI